MPITEFTTERASLLTLDEATASARLEAGEIGDYYRIPEEFRTNGEVTRVEGGSGLNISRLEGQENSEGLVRYVIQRCAAPRSRA